MSIQAHIQSNMASKSSSMSNQTGTLQRKCACGEHTIAGGECIECQRKEQGTLQRAAINTTAVNTVPPIVHDVLNSSGQPLDAGSRAFMEPRFGYDFSQVRVHTGAKAAASAQAVGALAYTVGRDVVFAAGQYMPGTTQGKQLLAHELTHSIQQAMITPSYSVQFSPSKRSDELERQAESVAQTIVKPTASEREVHTHTVPQIAMTAEAHLATKANPDAVAKMDGKTIRNDPDYIENNLVSIDFYGAEQAVLHYADSASLTIGLIPRAIKPPLETVDYHAARSEYAPLTPSSKELKFIPRIRDLPAQGMGYKEMLEKFSVTVKFTVDPSSGKIVPNHLNPVTSPKLCGLLRDAEAEYVKQFDEMSKGMIKILEKEKVILYLALARATLAGLKPTPAAPAAAAAEEFSAANLANRLFVATRTLANNGLKMLGAARTLSGMATLSAAQKVSTMLEYLKLIGFGISAQGVVDEGEYFVMYSEDGQYAFRFIKATAEITYGKFDMTTMDFIWRQL